MDNQVDIEIAKRFSRGAYEFPTIEELMDGANGYTPRSELTDTPHMVELAAKAVLRAHGAHAEAKRKLATERPKYLRLIREAEAEEAEAKEEAEDAPSRRILKEHERRVVDARERAGNTRQALADAELRVETTETELKVAWADLLTARATMAYQLGLAAQMYGLWRSSVFNGAACEIRRSLPQDHR